MKIKILNEIKEIKDFVFNRSIDATTASYIRLNTMKDVVKTLEREINNEFGELLGIYDNGKLHGVCSYYWIDKDKYMQTTVFVIDGEYNVVADYFIEHMKNGKEDYKLFIGMPGENSNAINYLEKKGNLSENSVNLILHKPAKVYLRNDNVVKIDKNNFNEFEKFYEKFAIKYDMYWNSKNLLNDISRFDILAYLSDEEIIGVIFAKNGESSQEIYGLFTDSKESIVFKGLLSELILGIIEQSEAVKITYFIDPTNLLELRTAEEFGFEVQDTYKGFEI
ncbi:MAG: hypothetical protein KQ78_01258 [Candidatus Izimaplasma bacterium HR2]|nr:MAG: hypothetical protein KQ78_01258 [Candidatus Izimaplasma bacterium HR2]